MVENIAGKTGYSAPICDVAGDDEEESDTHSEKDLISGSSEFIDISSTRRIGCRQQFTDCSNVFKGFIGAAAIGLPFAVSQSGIILCLVGVAIIAMATDHCCNLIVKCKHEVIKLVIQERLASGMDPSLVKDQESLLGRTLSFGRIGKICMGRTGLLLVNVSVMVTQFGFCIGYLIFLGNTMKSLIYQLLPNNTNVHNHSLAVNLSEHMAGLMDNVASQPFSPENLRQSRFETFAILVALPVPFLILISFLRNLRKLGPVSIIANGALTGACTATAIYMLATLKNRHEAIKLVNFPTFPIFFGQVTGAFEGIGTVIPIEGSMAENRGRYPCYLHISVTLLAVILSAFGIAGYLCYGHEVHQIITQDLQGPIAIALQIALFFGVFFTYPLQIYPCLMITESAILKFRRWRASSRRNHLCLRQQRNGVNSEAKLAKDPNLDSEKLQPFSTTSKIPIWEGNIVRAVLIIFTACVALVFRDMFAYVAALTGSIGSSLLSYILPCAFHIALKRHELSRWILAKDIAMIIFGVIGGVMGVTITLQEIVKAFGSEHS